MPKNSEYIWSTLTAADGAVFWSAVGPVATSKAVIKELGGYPVYVNHTQTWVIARDATGTVVAASAISPDKEDGSFWIDYAHVDPQARGNGLWTEMLARRLEIAAINGARSVRCCTATMARPLEAAGFKVTSQRGSWSYMEKVL